MTPSLAAVYDDLIAAAAEPARAEVVAEVRARFEARVSPFTPSDPWFEERSAALWDRVLVDARVLASFASAPLDREHRAALDALARAQRGIFEAHRSPNGVDLVCMATGAAFRLAKADDAQRSLGDGGGFVDAHVVPTAEGVALLPGLLVHPAEASEPLRELLATDLPLDELLDALLAMRHRLASRSRMRARQIYRPDALRRP